MVHIYSAILKFYGKFLPNRLKLPSVCVMIAVNKCGDEAYETTWGKCSRVARFFKCRFLVLHEAISNLTGINTVQNTGTCSLPPKFFSLHDYF